MVDASLEVPPVGGVVVLALAQEAAQLKVLDDHGRQHAPHYQVMAGGPGEHLDGVAAAGIEESVVLLAAVIPGGFSYGLVEQAQFLLAAELQRVNIHIKN